MKRHHIKSRHIETTSHFIPLHSDSFPYRDFILPLFIHESDAMEEISSMPGCFRHSVASMLAEVEEAMRLEYDHENI